MTKINLKEIEANSFNLGNLHHSVKIRGTGSNNNSISYFSIDNSVNHNITSRGITVVTIDEDMTLLSVITFDVGTNPNARFDLVNIIKYNTGSNYYILISFDSIDTDDKLDKAMSDAGANYWFDIDRVYGNDGVVEGFNKDNGSHRTPYVAFFTPENGIIYERIGLNKSGATNPHAELTISIPHKSEKKRLLINGINRSFVRFDTIIKSTTTFNGELKKKYQEYVRFVCNYKTISTVGYKIQLLNEGDNVVSEYIGSISSNIICVEDVIIKRNNATKYRIQFIILPNTNTQLTLSYATLSYSCFDQNVYGVNNTSVSLYKYGGVSSYDIEENYVGCSPFDKESYTKIYNSKMNLLKPVFDSKNNSNGYFFNSTFMSPCYHNNITFETPYIDIISNNLYYHFSMFNKCYDVCGVFINAYDSSFNLIETIKTSNNTLSKNHRPLQINNGYTDEYTVGFNEFFILPEGADNNSFFDDIQNNRYGQIHNTGGVHTPSSSHTIKYKRNTKFFKLIFTGNVKIFKPILTPLSPTISSNGNIYMGSFKEV